jgi:hypothetical protein
MTRWPSTWLVAPQRSRSASSMQSHRQHRVDQVSSLRPRMGRASPLAQVDELIGGLLDPEPLGQGGRQQPGIGDGAGVVKAAVELAPGVGRTSIENLPSWSGTRQLSQTLFSQVKGPFSESNGNHSMTGTVHSGERGGIRSRSASATPQTHPSHPPVARQSSRCSQPHSALHSVGGADRAPPGRSK